MKKFKWLVVSAALALLLLNFFIKGNTPFFSAKYERDYVGVVTIDGNSKILKVVEEKVNGVVAHVFIKGYTDSSDNVINISSSERQTVREQVLAFLYESDSKKFAAEDVLVTFADEQQ